MMDARHMNTLHTLHPLVSEIEIALFSFVLAPNASSSQDIFFADVFLSSSSCVSAIYHICKRARRDV